jgi:hypothetical protein
MEFQGKAWKTMKIHGNPRKCMAIHANPGNAIHHSYQHYSNRPYTYQGIHGIYSRNPQKDLKSIENIGNSCIFNYTVCVIENLVKTKQINTFCVIELILCNWICVIEFV